MINHRFHKLFAIWWIRLETAAERPEVEKGSARAEVAVSVGEGRAILSEVAVGRRRETLESHTKALLQALKHRHGQGHLGRLALAAANKCLIALEHAPHPW